MLSKTIGAVALAVSVAGCTGLKMEPGTGANPGGGGRAKAGAKKQLIGRKAWVPLNLSRESFEAAEKRLKLKVRLGMSRTEFFRVMQMNPGFTLEGAEHLTAGEGWFTQLARQNTFGGRSLEEYSFGYFHRFRLKERWAVILEDGAVTRIVASSWPESHGYSNLPDLVVNYRLSLGEETRILKEYYRVRLQTREAFERILPQLRKVRAGWTSAELRLALGGSLYRLQNGLVYLQEGLLWDEGFSQTGNGTSSVAILPFGYRTPDGRAHTSVIVRAEGGVVTAVFWQDGARNGGG